MSIVPLPMHWIAFIDIDRSPFSVVAANDLKVQKTQTFKPYVEINLIGLQSEKKFRINIYLRSTSCR